MNLTKSSRRCPQLVTDDVRNLWLFKTQKVNVPVVNVVVTWVSSWDDFCTRRAYFFFYIKRAVLACLKKKASASQASCTILTTTFYQMFCLFFLYNSFHILNSSVTLFQEEWHGQQQHTIELWPPLLYPRASVLWCATRSKELFTNPFFKQKCCLYHPFTKWK